MVLFIRALNNDRIAHQFRANRGRQDAFVLIESLPIQAIFAHSQMQTILTITAKGRKYKYLVIGGTDRVFVGRTASC